MASASIRPVESPAKRQKVTENIILKDLPANEFANKIKLFNGPKVIVEVAAEEFPLPKALLCYYSKFFEKAVNGRFKESVDQKVVLRGHTVEAFQMVIQWLFQSTVNLPSNLVSPMPSRPLLLNVENNSNDDSRKISGGATTTIKQENDFHSMTLSLYLDFLRLADYLQLLGPFDSVERAILNLLTQNRISLTPQHVNSAMNFPAGHSIRQLFVRATVKDFIDHIRLEKSFRFEKELEQVDGYAADLIREYSKAMYGKFVGVGGVADSQRCYVHDPLGGGRILVTMAPTPKRNRKEVL